MKWSLYQRVALKRDLPEHGLKRGDVATLVDLLPHPERGDRLRSSWSGSQMSKVFMRVRS
jgi:hypothetical protein